MQLETASFGITVVSLLVAIATFAYTIGIRKPVRLIICAPSLLLAALFGYVGFYYLITTRLELAKPSLIITPKLVAPILSQLIASPVVFPPDQQKVPTYDQALEKMSTVASPTETLLPAQTTAISFAAANNPGSMPIVQPTLAPAPTPNLSPGSKQPEYGDEPEPRESEQMEVGAAGVGNQLKISDRPNRVGNIITCVPPTTNAWIKLYRLDLNEHWYTVGSGIGSLEANGYLKIDGLEVDVARFGGSGEPYRVEQWVGGKVVRSTGNYQNGEKEFRVAAYEDRYTAWAAPCN